MPKKIKKSNRVTLIKNAVHEKSVSSFNYFSLFSVIKYTVVLSAG